MMLVALTPSHASMWWITLGLGAVVVVVVIVLLSLLVALVSDIEDNVANVWSTATKVARNTATTWMLGQTGVRTGELLAEVNRHAELLTAKTGGRA